MLNGEKEAIQSYLQENSRLEANLNNLREKYHSHLENDELQIQKFENIANKILKQQTSSFNEQQSKEMKVILDPFKEKIKTFEETVMKTSTESLKRHESLKEQIKNLTEQSSKVSADANNLAKALKGDHKKQGNWGEIILESILDKSGLVKDREFFLQQSERDDKNKIQKPDVVIHLPDGKRLIIDSKVSLISYDLMVGSETEEESKQHQKNHAAAIKNHIDGLSAKNYHDLYKIESPDFVLMFIPIDTAFSTALQYNPNLYQYAFDRNIVIVSSSTLLATLKTVETMWRNDKQNRYALEIADEAGKMYDKFVGFQEDLIKLGNQLNTANNTYVTSMNKLHTGSGNLVSRANKIKELGAKANKSIPQNLVDKALEE